ncbi:MAG TPA: TMEM175 family protein [Chloroflexota bacterium]|nr:TMEM175 family protein [Chloroflexota bacterium]
MGKERLTAFSDGVVAIIITIMVLELRVPHGDGLGELRPVLPVFLSYVLSFVNIAIYWNNHHHLLFAAERVNGVILWANMHLLFWLSLVPFTTGWMGEHPSAHAPAAIYGTVLLAAAIAYWLLQRAIIAEHGPQSHLAAALGRDLKGNASPLIYIAAVGLAFLRPWIADALYALVALIWLIPDPRIERTLASSNE